MEFDAEEPQMTTASPARANTPTPSAADDPRWERIVARDRAADGYFWYSVSTTGVYCRPSCPSRIALPKNVQLHDSLESARATGFRPCRRCHPDDASIDCGDNEFAETRVAAYDWRALAGELDDHGCVVLPALLSSEECRVIAGLYPDERYFRSHVHMARHGFGKGEYRYFTYPLPALVGGVRTTLYPHLSVVANDWNRRMGIDERYPDDHASFLARCHAAGQTRPTPLLLRYVAGDFNCLHQDLYGDLAFPIQVAILLSEPDVDFTGGELVLTEQRPRMQSRVEVVPLRQGDAVAFAVHNRPVRGSKGHYRVNLRHGVSRVRSGMRHTLGIIFHEAR
jgi:hypothetical protein